MKLTVIIKNGASSSALKKRLMMIEGVEGVETDKSDTSDADIAVWLEHGASPTDIEDLLHGTKGVRSVSLLK